MSFVQNQTHAQALPSWAAPRENVEVVRGNDYSIFNFMRQVAHIPNKLLIWNSREASGNVSIDTVAKTVAFLEDNGLEDVAVQVNDYSPFWFADRVFSNPKTSLLTKIFFGPMAVLGNLTGFQKIWGGNNYNFLSNSLYLSSDDPDLGLVQADQAKDFNDGSYPTLYAMAPGFAAAINPHVGAGVTSYMANNAVRNAQDWVDHKQSPAESARSYVTTASAAYVPVAVGFAASLGMAPAASYMQQMSFQAVQQGIDLPMDLIGEAVLSGLKTAGMLAFAAWAIAHTAIRMRASTMAEGQKPAFKAATT